MHLIKYTVALAAALVAARPASEDNAMSSVEKRDIKQANGGTVDCWTFQPPFPNHEWADRATDYFRGWGEGNNPFTTGAALASGNVMFYKCWDGPRHGEGRMSLADANHAIGEMDRLCGNYQPGYFRWQGTDEVVGRTYGGTRICLNNGSGGI